MYRARRASIADRIHCHVPLIKRIESTHTLSNAAGWFDIDGIGEQRFRGALEGQLFDPEGVAQSLQRIQELIDAEVASGTPKERIVLGGFSQAGHLALLAHLAQGDQPLAGCVALCTWIQPEAVKARLFERVDG